MPLPFEDVALRDLVKHPKLIILYAAFIGIGWITNRLLPDDCHQEVSRWQSLYYVTIRAKDSVQSSKDVLMYQFIQEKHEKSRTDSLLSHLGSKAGHILKKKSHEY